MKKKLLFLSMLISIFTIGNAQIQFSDANFKNALLNHNPVIDTNTDGQISIQEAEAATHVRIDNKGISNLDGIEKFINLEYIYANKNALTSIDVSNNINLTQLFLSENSLTQIDVSNNINLKDLLLDSNALTQLDVSNNSDLSYLVLGTNNLTHLDISNNLKLSGLDIRNNNLTQIDVSNNLDLNYLSLDKNSLTQLDISNNINLELLDLFNNELSIINVSNNTKLTRLNLRSNSITQLDVSNNVSLAHLDVSYNYALREIDLSNNVNLTYLNLDRNELTQINVSNNSSLTFLGLSQNTLTQIDISNNPNLITLHLNSTNLNQLDVTNNKNLEWLSLSNNNLTEIDLSNQNNLTKLYIDSNQISTLDVRSSSLLDTFTFGQNPKLKTVFMTGQKLESLRVALHTCPELEFICADQKHLDYIYQLLVEANQTSCLLSSDCDDNPYNIIQGSITYDIDNDGCDVDDIPFTGGVRVSAISLINGESIIAYPNEDGKYTIHANDGTYFIGPALQNLTYFTFSTPIFPAPTTLPNDLDGLVKDYCVQPIGLFNDLEVNIIPLGGAAIPGFEANYLITYTNIGTTTQSGTVTVDYQDDVLNYNSSIPTVTSNINGQLTWGFQDLAPMESAEIPVSFVLNTPTDPTNPLNSGNVLNFTATVTGATDQTPNNNVMMLSQTVVNSYDPNDKTCLEGTILDPDDVGNYLHYLIRFENEGTANAVNIRVTDAIDTTKLEIESFVPLKSSHSYSTMITNGGEIEFTFSNINLPFDDSNNDGYVLFKIKSKDNLVEGDTIVNSAAIYFDFNFPIITEDEIVTVKREIVSAPEFSDYFTLSPNPTTGIMNLSVLDESINISHLLIYDIGSNLVGFYLGTTRTMNVNYLFPNSYIMKIITNKGDFSTQFIKL